MTVPLKIKAWHPASLQMYTVTHLDLAKKYAIFFRPRVNKRTMGRSVSVSLDEVALLFWTGLYDKNGKEIFEGDLVKGCQNSHMGDVQAVKYKGGGFEPFAIPGWEITPRPNDVKIIGNFYQNPEFLH